MRLSLAPSSDPQPIISPRYQADDADAGPSGGLAEEASPPPPGPTAAENAAAADALARSTAALALLTAAADAKPRSSRMPPLGAARQCHENDLAEVVIVCEPEGTSLMMGGLHPR